VADTDRVSARAYPMLQQQILASALVRDRQRMGQRGVRGELPPAFARAGCFGSPHCRCF